LYLTVWRLKQSKLTQLDALQLPNLYEYERAGKVYTIYLIGGQTYSDIMVDEPEWGKALASHSLYEYPLGGGIDQGWCIHRAESFVMQFTIEAGNANHEFAVARLGQPQFTTTWQGITSYTWACPIVASGLLHQMQLCQAVCSGNGAEVRLYDLDIQDAYEDFAFDEFA